VIIFPFQLFHSWKLRIIMTQPNIVTSDTRMADVIHMNYLLLPVINRFGIQLGFGDQTVEQVCRQYSVNLSFFLDIINAYHDESYFPKEKMRAYPVDMIVDYLLKTHEYYRQKMLPETQRLVEDLIGSCSSECDHLNMIADFFSKYKQELENHLRSEEIHFFPYVQALTKIEESPQNPEEIRSSYNFSYNIHSEEHDNVISKMLDLKNIIIKYLPPNYNNTLCNNLLYWLFIFEKDLKDHERLEDIILLPALRKIENRLMQNH